MSHDLVGRVAERLREGPLHTVDLARQALGLSGNPRAASAAVFTLLGSDPRFHVDGTGRWSLRDPRAGVDESLTSPSYAVVDVETTGGRAGRGHRIIEIAVVEVRDGVIADDFRTLVNPGARIPRMITRITGITSEMVAPAPYFDAIAGEVLERLRGRVFVAHNARFDWGFVRAELAEAVGEVPEMRKLCTVRMTRRLVPRLRRRNLDAVARHFGVPIEGRHRAFGDAFATARILIRLLDEAAARGIPDLATLEAHLAGRHQLQLPFEGRP